MERLEDRTLLAATLSLTGAQTLLPGANINVSNNNQTVESEMSVDINPRNPLNVAGFSSGKNVFFSMDGGTTWSRTRIRDINGDGIAGINDDGLGSGNRFDPSIAFDALGTLYISYGVTAGNRTKLVVARSNDGGANFNQFTVVDDRANTSGLPGVDKYLLATGLDPSTGNQAVYVAYTQNVEECFIVCPFESVDQRIVVSGSNDGGLTFTNPRVINDGSIGDGTDSSNIDASPAVGPNGELYIVWNDTDAGDHGKIRFDRDLDGLWGADHSFGGDVTVRTLRTRLSLTTSIDGDPVEAQPNRGIINGPVLAVDHSGGSRNGWLYVTFVDVDLGTDPDVFLTASDDFGAHWDSKGHLGDVDKDLSTDFLPWVAVDQSTGSVNVAFYTTSGDENTGDDDVHVWLGSSIDGGENFTGTRLTTARSRASAATSSGGNDFLEYIGLAVHDGTAQGLWSDNRGVNPGGFRTDLDAFTANAAFQSDTNENTLTVTGDDFARFFAPDDLITIGRSQANRNFLEVRVNTELQFAGLLATLDHVTINAGLGDDFISVLTDLGGVPLSILGGDGDDTIYITPGVRSLDGFFASVTIDGGGGSDTLNIYDQSNPYSFPSLSNLYTITASSVSRWFGVRFFGPLLVPFTASISYDDIEALEINAGLRSDVIDVRSTDIGNSVSVNAGGGNDAINVGSAQTIGVILGPLSVHGQFGHDSLNINDQSNNLAFSYTITDSTVQRSLSALITYDNTVDHLIIDGGGLDDTFAVRSTSIWTTINAGAGADTFTVGSIQNSLDPIAAGRLDVEGGPDNDTLHLMDQGDDNANTYTLGATIFERTGTGLVVYSSIQTLNLNAGRGADTLNVQRTAAGAITTVNAWLGSDTINVGSAFNSLDGIISPLTIQGSLGSDTLNLVDLGDADANSYTLTATTFQRSGTALVTYDTIQALNLYAGVGDDTIDVLETASGVNTTVVGWLGNDTINVDTVFAFCIPSDIGVPGCQEIDTIQGPLTVQGSFDDDTVNINDDERSGYAASILTETTLDRSGLALITYGTTETLNLRFGSGPDQINVWNTGADTTIDALSSADTIYVLATAAGTNTTVNGGTGDDTIQVGTPQGYSLSYILGSLTVAGQYGTDLLHVTDEAALEGHSYVVAGNNLLRDGGSLLTFDTENLSLAGSGEDDTVDVTGTPVGSVLTIDGSGGSNTLTGSNLVNFFFLTGLDAGTMSCCGGPIFFTSFQNLLGNFGSDTFVFSAGPGLSGTISDLGGTDTLDYSTYTTAVIVNLLTGSATGVAGGVSGIENVTGGFNNDTIIGDAAANVLRGGAGRDLLIGGLGVDQLEGGDDDDLLIGGATDHDANDAALAAIMAEWSRTDQSYDDRINHLMNGGGLNDAYLLNLYTASDDAAANTLSGNAATDWFFANVLDLTDWDLAIGEQLVLL